MVSRRCPDREAAARGGRRQDRRCAAPGARRRGLLGGGRRRRQRGPLACPRGKLRPHPAGHHAAGLERLPGLRRAAPRRRPHADPHAHGQGRGPRRGRGAGHGGRRLPPEAVLLPGAGVPDPRTAAPGRGGGAAAAGDRGSPAGAASSAGDARDDGDRAHRARVRPAHVPDPPPGTGGLQDPTARRCLGGRLRRRPQRGRGLHRPPASQDRRAVRTAHHRYRAGRRVPHPAAMTGAPSRGWRARTGTLRFRVSAGAVLAVVLVLGAAGVALVLVQYSTLLNDLDETLTHQAEVVQNRVQAGEPLRPTDLLSDDIAVLVSGPDGDELAGSPGLIGMLFRYGPPPPQRAFSTVALSGPDGAARVHFLAAGESRVWVAGPLDDVRDSTAALIRSLLIAIPASALALALLVWWTVGRTLRPVENIRAEVERISGSRLERRVPEPRTADEIARLAHTMNAMLDRLEAAAEQQRRFVADASHELRSPLARMRAEIEVDRAHPAFADPAQTQKSVLEETARLQRLVDDLLLLARGDAGAVHGARAEPVDLDDMVEQVVVVSRRSGPPRIDTHGVVPVQVTGNRVQLDRVVANLLDNAVRHARDRVTVELREGDGVAVLTVADDGPGIPAEARESVFERFSRLDDARSADGGGAGLGLAIARDIAVRHGGSLVLDGEGTSGARFVLTLPLDGRVPPRTDG